jgi:hypothetical protein
MDQELIAYLDERFGENARQIQGLRQEMTQRLERVEEGVRHNQAHLERLEEGGRHTRVLVEGVRDEVRLVAEGVMGLDERIGFLRTELKQDIEDVRTLIPPVFLALDQRVRVLEHRNDLQRRDPIDMIRERYGKKPGSE